VEAEEGALTPPAEPAPPAVETPEAEDEGLPEWMRDLDMPVVDAEPTPSVEPALPAVETPEAEDEGLPDWMRDLDTLEDKEDIPSETPAPVVSETTLQPPATELPVEQIEEETEFEIPQWLQDLQQGEPGPIQEAPEPATPDWLVPPPAPDVTVETDQGPIPDFPQGEEPFPSPAETEEQMAAELPSWLQELRPSAKAPVTEEEMPPVIQDRDEISEPSVSQVPDEIEDLVPADIPDWLLALRPQESAEEEDEEVEIMELRGPLTGIRGVLPVEPIISLPHLTRPEVVAVETPPVSGDLLAEIVGQPPAHAVPVSRPRDERIMAGVQRVLIYLLVLAAVVVPLFMGPIYGPLDAVDLNGGAESFYALLDGRTAIALPTGSVVVVAFDYNLATAAELSLQARAIVNHLMSRDLRIMALSLYPEGAALASNVLDELAAAHGYVYGEHYVHLGYLPNQPASVRHFLNQGPTGKGRSDYRYGQPVSQYAVAQGIKDLSSVRLVVELAGDERSLQAWVEQMSAQTNVPLAAGVSAATAPYVQPYLDSGQLQALLVGLPGAAEYEAQTGRVGDATKSLGSQVAAQGVIVLLILLGNLIHLATRGGKK
jgi:hypothetical protein